MTGGYHSLLSSDYYTSGLLIRGMGLAISCAGAYLGLRCASRARACTGWTRARWLLLGGVSVGAVAIWATDFIAMLGLTVPGQSIRYNVPLTLLSLLAAVVVMCAGLLVIGLGGLGTAALAAASVIIGLGIASAHYLGVAALRMSAQISYDSGLLAVSVVTAILATAALLWAAARLRGTWPALGAAVVAGIVVSGMHDAGAAAVRLSPVSGQAGTAAGGGSGATAASFVIPLVIGLAVLLFLTSAAVVLSPTEEAVRYDQSLLDTIRRRGQAPLDVTPLRPARSAGTNGSTAKSSPPWTVIDLTEVRKRSARR
jgi:NO-binding membrane sensor protein with MHYT domain